MTVATEVPAADARAGGGVVGGALGEVGVARCFAGWSRNLGAVGGFGIAEAGVLGFWDWVVGRYSVWGASGLPVMIASGPARFGELLDGGFEMDEHFRS